MATKVPVHQTPVGDPREAVALYWDNMSALAAVVQAITFERYPDPTSEVHESVGRRRMDFAEGLKLLLHQWITLFLAPAQTPSVRGRAKKKVELDAERDALNAAVAAGVDAHFTNAPMPNTEALRHRALDLAAAAMMFHLGLPPDSKLAQHMTEMTMRHLAGLHDVPPWQTALRSRLELASLWTRDRKGLTPREIAISICAYVAAVPGAPQAFNAPTADQLESLTSVINNCIRGDKTFRLPGANKRAGGRKGTRSSWAMAAEFADMLDEPMSRAHDVRRPPRKKGARTKK